MPVYDTDLWQHFKTGILSMNSRLKIFNSVIDGLIYIQKSGLKHLDIKPSNVLLNLNDLGHFNGTDCVITDFGIGGKTDKENALAGTPGFASPEQLIGQATELSDNYSMGRLMIMLFAKWDTAWELKYKPCTEQDVNTLLLHSVIHNLYPIIRSLLQVNIIQ